MRLADFLVTAASESVDKSISLAESNDCHKDIVAERQCPVCENGEYIKLYPSRNYGLRGQSKEDAIACNLKLDNFICDECFNNSED